MGRSGRWNRKKTRITENDNFRTLPLCLKGSLWLLGAQSRRGENDLIRNPSVVSFLPIWFSLKIRKL